MRKKRIIRFKEKQDGLYHEAINLYILNDEGKLLIQRRSRNHPCCPGKWAVVIGATPYVENGVTSSLRELKEELGLEGRIENLEYIGMIKQKFCFMDVFLLRQNFNLEDIKFIDGEVEDAKFVSVQEFNNMLTIKEAVSDTFAIFEYYLKLNN